MDVVWVILCAILVTTMQAGFCCLESGLVRAKNSINVAIKNLVDFCIACTIYWAVGFGLMFGQSQLGLVGSGILPEADWNANHYAFFLFQLVFCGTATTIVSGAVAERMSFLGYFLTATLLSSLIYPVSGHWIWGGEFNSTDPGWLARLQFHDFAGSTVVHSVGGWVSLAAILIIGPRTGRFQPHARPVEGDNLPIAVLGVFLLWFGWFGFNGGSTYQLSEKVPQILVNTAHGGAMGGLMALLTTWVLDRRPKVPLIMNGVIGGLVAVTAGCDLMGSASATWTGAVAGLLCTLADKWMAKQHIDDAVGVVPAHLVCGIWGTVAVALFVPGEVWGSQNVLGQRLAIQLLGVVIVGAYAFGMGYGLLWLLDRIVPLRVTVEQERVGLNISEHGASTAIQQLLTSMKAHSLVGDFSQPVEVEPETDAAAIAIHYNNVLQKVQNVTSELVASRERLLTILNSQAFPVVISEPETGVIHYLNERAAELFGFTLPETGRYREPDFWATPTTRAEFLDRIRRDRRVLDFETELRRVNGDPFWSLISGVELLFNDERCFLFSCNDISARKVLESELRALAETDPLTGIHNRRSFLNGAAHLLMATRQEGQPLCVAILDVDHFKSINDTFGHATGDRALQHLVQICLTTLRQGDLLGRLGGEEFALILPQTPPDAGQMIAERLRRAVAESTLKVGQLKISLSISIGITPIAVSETLENALSRADQALYRAKHKGRNRVEVARIPQRTT
ncbi:ammonium transporter [Lyngbya confervoides]|uniref:Ammonium transporter n=1 Tax=Lyngbya confervoides BDU141951 TaxID=1574623 RepID=A0ABD4T4Y1_9CYAN|nr:ammonium transporter [Lyngbya confervoides]MCM1983410.1 ammonium transporter [Lyngbya confervoides BDU141951]